MHKYWFLIIFLIGCEPKQAEDPHDLLAEEYERAAPGTSDGPGEEPDPGLAPATRAECERAIQHLFALGGAEPDAPARQRMQASVDECLARGTSRREAECIARIRSEAEIDRCSRQ